ncbi:hypothetical protein PFISCL1PPCAC_4785, partial [Pristionchus fissidentatus]
AHVYKYADRNQLFYQCQISISVKEPNQECARPQCPEARNFGAKKVAEDAAVEQTTAAYNPSSAAPAATTAVYAPTSAPAAAPAAATTAAA